MIIPFITLRGYKRGAIRGQGCSAVAAFVGKGLQALFLDVIPLYDAVRTVFPHGVWHISFYPHNLALCY